MMKTFSKQNCFKYVLVAFFFILTFLFVGCAKTEGEDIFRFEVRQLTEGDIQELKLVYGSIEDKEICVEVSDNTVLAIEKEKINAGEKVKVTAVKEGTVQLTVYVDGEENVTDTIVVTVEKEYLTYMQITSNKEEILIGETAQFSVMKVIPENISKDVEWSVSDETIGKVDQNGVFTGLYNGVVNVIATSKYDGTIKALKSIEVNYNPTTEITVVEEEVTLRKLDTYQIAAGVLPNAYPAIANPSLTYKTSKATVAKVDANGLVTAVDGGETNITISSVDGVTKVVKITVYCDPRESVTLYKDGTVAIEDGATIEITAGDTFQLSLVVLPQSANTTLGAQYTVSDGDVATVSKTGRVNKTNAGTTTIKVEYKDDDEAGTILSITFTLVVKEEVVETE